MLFTQHLHLRWNETVVFGVGAIVECSSEHAHVHIGGFLALLPKYLKMNSLGLLV